MQRTRVECEHSNISQKNTTGLTRAPLLSGLRERTRHEVLHDLSVSHAVDDGTCGSIHFMYSCPVHSLESQLIFSEISSAVHGTGEASERIEPVASDLGQHDVAKLRVADVDFDGPEVLLVEGVPLSGVPVHLDVSVLQCSRQTGNVELSNDLLQHLLVLRCSAILSPFLGNSHDNESLSLRLQSRSLGLDPQGSRESGIFW